MDDLKKYLEINSDSFDKLKIMNVISSDLDYWKDIFKYNEKRTNLENFLSFRTASSLKLYKKGFDDPDSTPAALNYLKNKLYEIEGVEKVEIGTDIEKYEKTRTFLVTLNDGKKIYLESDTANSLMGDLGIFLRNIIKKHIEIPKGENWAEATYMKQYGLKKGNEVFRNYYWYTLIPELIGLLKCKTDIECFKVLEKRASLTHTFNNLILVPYGYNSKRGYNLKTYNSKQNINDRLDLTIIDFNEMIDNKDFTDEIFHKRLGNKKCSMYSVKFLLENKGKLFPEIPNYPKDIKENTIEWIFEVSNEINGTLENRL